MSTDASPTIWVRLIADDRFREAFIDDPLRALADAGPVTVSPEQVRAFEEMSPDDRREAVTHLVREAHFRGGAARFGLWDPDWRPVDED